MKKLFFFLLLLPIYAFCEDFRLSFLIGDVFVKQKDKKEFVKASLNMVIKEEDIIRTGEEGEAEITRKDDCLKIKANTTFVVKVLREKRDIFSVIFGKVWVRIKRLKNKETSFETPTAVMGLRGTIFSVDVLGKRTIVDLLEGELDIFVEGKAFILKQRERFLHDQIEKRIEKRAISESEINKFKEIFKLKTLPQGELPQGGLPQGELPQAQLAILKPKERLFSLFKLPEEKEDLKEEIEEVKAELSNERLSILSVKENDFQVGRTMRDKWGNLTRVEQHLYRPTNKEIRFVNINKRETTNNNTSQFSYGMLNITFNKELPGDISKWKEWINAVVNENIDFHPERIESILSNGRPQDSNADRMKWEYTWNNNNNELKGPTFWIDRGGDNADYIQYSNDWKEKQSIVRPKNELSKEETFDIYDTNDPQNVAGEISMGLYLINNEGKQLTEDDLNEMNFSNFLKDTGCELRFNSPLLNKPIDIIFTADIVVEGIKKLTEGIKKFIKGVK